MTASHHIKAIAVHKKRKQYNKNDFFGFNSERYLYSILLDKDDFKIIIDIILKSERNKDDKEKKKYLITPEIAKKINEADILIDFNFDTNLYILIKWTADEECFLFKSSLLENIN